MTQGVRTSLARADEIAPDRDEYGHKRGAEVDNAAKLGNTSARVAMALGRLSGTFHHNINVHRTQGDGKDPGERKKRFLDAGGGVIEIPTTSSHPPLDKALKRWHAEEDEIERLEEEARREEERRKIRAGGPPPREK